MTTNCLIIRLKVRFCWRFKWQEEILAMFLEKKATHLVTFGNGGVIFIHID